MQNTTKLSNVATLIKTTGMLGSTEEHDVSHINGDYVVMADDSSLVKTSLETIKRNQNYKLLNADGDEITLN